jgi:hypothetical protein
VRAFGVADLVSVIALNEHLVMGGMFCLYKTNVVFEVISSPV